MSSFQHPGDSCSFQPLIVMNGCRSYLYTHVHGINPMCVSRSSHPCVCLHKYDTAICLCQTVHFSCVSWVQKKENRSSRCTASCACIGHQSIQVGKAVFTGTRVHGYGCMATNALWVRSALSTPHKCHIGISSCVPLSAMGLPPEGKPLRIPIQVNTGIHKGMLMHAPCE